MRLFIDTGNGLKQVAGMTLQQPRPAQQTEGVLTVYGTFRPAAEFSLLTSVRFGRDIDFFVRGAARNREDWLSKTNAVLDLNARCHDDLSYLCEIIENTIVGADRRNVIPETIAVAEQMVMSRYRQLVIELAVRSGNSWNLPAGYTGRGRRRGAHAFQQRTLFDAYSMLGLASSVLESRSDVEKLLVSQNYNLAELLQYTDRIARERGIELVERTKTGAIRAVL